MLSSKDLFQDLAKLDKVCEDCKDLNIRALLKANILTVKLLQNIRANQQLELQAKGIKFIVSKSQSDQ